LRGNLPMKELNLPTGETVSFSFKITDEGYLLGGNNTIGEDEFGSLKIARDNGGKILFGSSFLEREMDSIIKQYFLGSLSCPDDRFPLFEETILQGALSFNSKKDIIHQIAHIRKALKKKDKSSLQMNLKKMMVWRNAFAHGHVMYDSSDGCFVEYYTSNTQALILDDHYWLNVEKTYGNCLELLKTLKDSL